MKQKGGNKGRKERRSEGTEGTNGVKKEKKWKKNEMGGFQISVRTITLELKH